MSNRLPPPPEKPLLPEYWLAATCAVCLGAYEIKWWHRLFAGHWPLEDKP